MFGLDLASYIVTDFFIPQTSERLLRQMLDHRERCTSLLLARRYRHKEPNEHVSSHGINRSKFYLE